MSNQPDQSPDYIEEQIEETRHQLSDTLQELQRRLSPSDIFQETVNYLKANESFGRNVAATIRENPVPACLMGIGLTWLMANGASGPRHDGRRPRNPLGSAGHRLRDSFGKVSGSAFGARSGNASGSNPGDVLEAPPIAGDPHYSNRAGGPTPQPYSSGTGPSSSRTGEVVGDPRFSDHPEGPTPQAYSSGAGASSSGTGQQAKQKMDDAKDKASQTADSAKEKASQAAGSARSTLSHAADSARERLQDAKSQLSHTAASTKGKLSGATDRAQHKGSNMNERYQNAREKSSEMGRNMREGYHQRTHEMRHRANSLLEDSPLTVVAIGFGVGVALGLMLPSTRREDEMMGSTRDQLRDRAVHEGHEQFERAREQVEAAAEATREHAQQETGSQSSSGSSSATGGSSAAGSQSNSATSGRTSSSTTGSSTGASATRGGDGKPTGSSSSPR